MQYYGGQVECTISFLFKTLIIIVDSTSGYEMIDSQSHEVHSVKLDIIISYPTNTSGIVVLLKLPPK